MPIWLKWLLGILAACFLAFVTITAIQVGILVRMTDALGF